MYKKLPTLLLLFLSTIIFGQEISFTFVNARNTNDGANDYYEADIYIASTVDFKLGSGQIYFNFNTAAFGENIKASGNFDYQQPSESILGSMYGGFPAYKDFVDNDNTTSRVSISFQQGLSSGTITANNVTATPTHLFSIKIKYEDVNEDPMVAFEDDNDVLDKATDQFYTACGPASFGFPDCFNEPGTQILNGAFDSTGASRISEIVWDGDTDASWSVASNWDSGSTPSATDDIIVPNVATTPEITTNVQVNDLEIESLSSFDISANGSVTVDGDFTNNGSFTITSNTTNSGSLVTNGSVTGNVTYERGGLKANVWSIVSAPVSGQSIKDFVENASNDIRKNTSVTPNLYAVGYYDDSKAAGSKWVYYDVDYLAANPSETFESGRSYAISRATDGVLSFTGTVATVDIPKAVTASEWNAIGNPYTAFMPINENSGTNFINTNAGNLDAAYVGVYVWDNTQNKYVAKSLVTDEASLAPGQGFFVKTGAGISTIDFNEAQRMVQPLSGGDFSRTTAQNSGIVLSAKTAKSTVTTTLKYLNTATEGLDPGYDLGNHGGASFDIYTRLVGSPEAGDFTIQSLPSLSEKIIIPVGLKAAENSKITFTVSLDNLADTTVFIEDKATGSFTKLNDSSYEFTTTEKISGTGRFYLHVQPKQEEVPTNLSAIKIYTATNHLIVSGIQKETFTVRLFTIQGREVLSKTTQGTGVNEIALPSIPTGIYVVKLTSELGEKSSKVIIK